MRTASVPGSLEIFLLFNDELGPYAKYWPDDADIGVYCMTFWGILDLAECADAVWKGDDGDLLDIAVLISESQEFT
jgi:hypothetical protein